MNTSLLKCILVTRNGHTTSTRIIITDISILAEIYNFYYANAHITTQVSNCRRTSLTSEERLLFHIGYSMKDNRLKKANHDRYIIKHDKR